MTNKVTRLLNKLKRGADRLNAEFFEDQSEMHKEVMQLRDDILGLFEQHKSKLTLDQKKAAEGFIKDLNNILNIDSPKQESKHPRVQYALAENVINISFKYQRRLESAPGFWNQLKALINLCIERLTGGVIPNIFDTGETVFSQAFNEGKGKVLEKKEEIKLGFFKSKQDKSESTEKPSRTTHPPRPTRK